MFHFTSLCLNLATSHIELLHNMQNNLISIRTNLLQLINNSFTHFHFFFFSFHQLSVFTPFSSLHILIHSFFVYISHFPLNSPPLCTSKIACISLRWSSIMQVISALRTSMEVLSSDMQLCSLSSFVRIRRPHPLGHSLLLSLLSP